MSEDKQNKSTDVIPKPVEYDTPQPLAEEYDVLFASNKFSGISILPIKV